MLAVSDAFCRRGWRGGSVDADYAFAGERYMLQRFYSHAVDAIFSFDIYETLLCAAAAPHVAAAGTVAAAVAFGLSA